MLEPKWNETLQRITELHDAKNNDYNGTSRLYLETGVAGRFADIWRKVIRLKTLAVDQQPQMVKYETVRDTAEDLVVYSILMLMFLEEQHNKEKN